MDREVDLGHWSIGTTSAAVARERKNLKTLLLGFRYLVYGWVMGRGVDIGPLVSYSLECQPCTTNDFMTSQNGILITCAPSIREKG